MNRSHQYLSRCYRTTSFRRIRLVSLLLGLCIVNAPSVCLQAQSSTSASSSPTPTPATPTTAATTPATPSTTSAPSSGSSSASVSSEGGVNYSHWPKRSDLWRNTFALMKEGKSAEAEQLLEAKRTEGELPEECEALYKEMKFKKLFDPQASDKQDYEVRRGDSLTSIARKTKSSVEYIMAMNGIIDQSKLSQGAKLRVRELNMKIIVDTKRNKILLVDGEAPLKEYEIKLARDTGTVAVKANIAAKIGEIDGLPVQVANDAFPASNKVLQIQGGLMIKGNVGLNPQDKGFFLAPEDANELALFLVPGNVVEILR